MRIASRFAIATALTLTLIGCSKDEAPQPQPAANAAADTERAERKAAEEVVARSTPGKIVTLELPVILDEAGIFPKCNDSKPLDKNPLPEDIRYCAAVSEIENAKKGALENYEQKTLKPTEEKISADFDAAITGNGDRSTAYSTKREAESLMYRDKRASEGKIYSASNQALAGIQKLYLGNGITVRFEIK